MGVFGRTNTASQPAPASDQATREISASQLAEVLARVDGDRPSAPFERSEGRISGARRIEPRPMESGAIATSISTAPHPHGEVFDLTPPTVPALPTTSPESSVAVRAVVVRHSVNLRRTMVATAVGLVFGLTATVLAILLVHRH
jgi:hypothetical protein